jgi:hypothetical protein
MIMEMVVGTAQVVELRGLYDSCLKKRYSFTVKGLSVKIACE